MKRTKYYRPANRDYMIRKTNLTSEIAMLVIAAAILFSACQAKACDEVYVGAASYHVNDDRDLKSVHALLSCEKSGYIVGAMENSHGNPTALAGKQFKLFESGYIESVVYVGLTYGYYGCDNSEDTKSRTVCPMVVPEISYTKYRVKPAVVLLGNAAALTTKISF